MVIAPGYRDTDWRRLTLDDAASPDWSTGIDILEKRIKARYVEPADMLVGADQPVAPADRRFGFTVLAIDCLLIETLQAFIEGRKDSKGHSGRMFRAFLTTRRSFSTDFDQERANRFYDDFRCGILHQAEIPANSRLWSVGPLVSIADERMTVNRSKFHKGLKVEFDLYLKDLAEPHNVQLRKHFRAKMGHICPPPRKVAVVR